MRKLRFYAFVMLCVLLASCQEEIVSPDKVKADLPAVIDLSLALPSSDKVETKGIYDYETEVSELMLIMFEENGRKMVILLDDELQPTTFDASLGGYRGYTTNGEISVDADGNPILSGTYRVYAIANWSGEAFGNLTTENLKAMSEEELKRTVASNTGFAYKVSGDERFPMSSYTEEVVINPYDPNGATAVSVTLRRLIAHIEFIFRNGTEVANPSESVTAENPRFTPHSFSVYNIPRNAYLISEGTGEKANMLTEDDLKVYGKAENIEIIGDGKIEFFMLENVQDYGASETYVQRDAWTGGSEGYITAPDGKSFKYAPKNSTYVVVKGEYVGTKYFGEVSYTIHLGNFSSKSLTDGTAQYSRGGYDNFTVNRNEYHTYTVTVNGVNSVVTENQTGTDEGGANPGAEGTLTQTSGTQFVLDAHYETVMLSFELDEKCQEPSMIVSTPYNAMQKYTLFGEAADYAGADYKWVKFMAPTSTSSLPAYPKEADQETKLTDIVGLAEELREAFVNNYTDTSVPSGAHYMISDGKVYVVAFVDEYFYEDTPYGRGWPGFVNQDNRVLILNPDKDTSIDGNSTAYPTYIFSISQRSIKTTYATASQTVNAFGIETWNETGRVAWGSPYSETGLDDYNGYANTQTLLGDAWLSETLMETTGYRTSISDNTKESHVFYSSGDGLSGIYGYNSCLTRNRDENGNGVIDDGELKWYLPAVFQYTALWMGLDYLKEDTQLFDPKTEISYSDELTEYNFYTSSDNGSAKSQYWSIEGASYGDRKHTNAVRCVRNLYDSNGNGIYDDVNPKVSVNDSENRIITVTGASESALRTETMTGGEYTAGHTERDANNRLPHAFEVALNILGVSSVNKETFEISQSDITIHNVSDKTITLSFPKEGYTYSANVGGVTTTFSGTASGNLTVSINVNNPGNNTWATVTVTNENTYASGKMIIWFDYSSGSYDGYKIYKYDESNTSQWGWSKEEITSIELSTGSEGVLNFTYSDIANKVEGLCASLYSQENGADLGSWRVPNQRELMLMAEHEYLTDAGQSNAYASRTFYTYSSLGKYEPFSYNGHLTLQSDSGNSFVIRCVRDAAPATDASLNDAVYSNSGNTIF